jgi:hypothetical protein
VTRSPVFSPTPDFARSSPEVNSLSSTSTQPAGTHSPYLLPHPPLGYVIRVARISSEEQSIWRMARKGWELMADSLWHGTEPWVADGATFPSDLVLQTIRYQLFSPSITCYTPSAIRSSPNEIRFTRNAGYRFFSQADALTVHCGGQPPKTWWEGTDWSNPITTEAWLTTVYTIFLTFQPKDRENSRERETRVPASFTGGVWSKSFRSRMTRLHGGIKAREIMYAGTWPFRNLTRSVRRLRYASPTRISIP